MLRLPSSMLHLGPILLIYECFSCELFFRYACEDFKVPHLWCVFGNKEDVTFLILVVIIGKCRLGKNYV